MRTEQNRGTRDAEFQSRAEQFARLDPSSIRSNPAMDRGGRLRILSFVHEVRNAVVDLLRKRKTTADPFLSIVERIRAETRIVPFADVLKRLDSFAFSTTAFESTSEIDSLSLTCRLPHAVRTAVLASGLLPATGIRRAAAETVMLGALLQDVGFATLARRHDCTPRELQCRNVDAYRSHPIHGAAIASGLRRCACDLPAIIAEHHERLNGIGYPHGRRARQLTSASRFLQIVCHFVEHTSIVQSTPDAHSDRPTSFSAAIARACDDLEEQTALERFDVGLSNVVLQQIRPVAIEADGETRERGAAANVDGRAVPAPKFVSRGATPAGLSVFVQSTADRDLTPDSPSM